MYVDRMIGFDVVRIAGDFITDNLAGWINKPSRVFVKESDIMCICFDEDGGCGVTLYEQRGLIVTPDCGRLALALINKEFDYK